MLFIGLILLTAGFVLIYNGAFVCRYHLPSSLFSFITSFIVISFNEFSHKIIALITFSLIALFFHFYLKSTFINPKKNYIVFNVKTYDLMDILGEILKKQSIGYFITNYSILLDSSNEEIIEVKPKIFGLNFLSLSDSDSADLLSLIDNELYIALSQVASKRIPVFGAFVFTAGLITTILFYNKIY